MERIRWALVCLLTVSIVAALVALAHADVLCARKIGANVRLRAVCKANEIQLDPVALNLQGPQGDPGAPGNNGAPGNDGAPGAPGSDAEVLHVYDGNGQDLGILTDGFGETRIVYLPAVDAMARVEANTLLVGDRRTVFFSDLNCTGTPYMRGFESPQSVVSADGVRFFKTSAGEVLATTSSRLDSNGVCSNQSDGGGMNVLQEITLPFDLPLAHPVTVGLAP